MPSKDRKRRETNHRRPLRGQARSSVIPDSFPRPTGVFVGRKRELRRLVELIDRDVLFSVYGVAGIGKTEFVYRLLEIIREVSPWRGSTKVLVQVRAQMTEEHLLALLRFQCEKRMGSSTDFLGRSGNSLEDDLERVVYLLNAKPHLIFVDDLHLMDVVAASRIIGHLARHLRKSRLLVASRLEIPLTSGVLPVVTRLEPLDAAAGAQMVAGLGSRLGIQVTDPTALLRRSGGSPFLIQREVAVLARALLPGEDVLDASLRDLEPEARATLLRAAVLSGRAAPVELVRPGGEAGSRDAILESLARRFLLEFNRDQVVVHDLVRDAVIRRSEATEVTGARLAASRYLLEQFQKTGNPFDGVEAVTQLVAAGLHSEALRVVEASYRALSAAGADHLLLGPIASAGRAPPELRATIDLLLARILVRRSLISKAQEVLSEVALNPAARASVRYLVLAGNIAQRTGDLAIAEDLFRRARDVIRDQPESCRLALPLANILALRGDSAGAQAVLASVEDGCKSLSVSDALRWKWSQVLGLVLEQSFEAAAATAAATRKEGTAPPGTGEDQALLLAMLQALSLAEIDDVGGAREIVDRIVAPAAREGALREQVANFFRGVVCWSEGDLRSACVLLEETFQFFTRHHDEVLACIAGHYLGRTRIALGAIREAFAVLDETTARVAKAGVGSLAPIGAAVRAMALLFAGQVSAAREEMEGLLCKPSLGAYAHDIVLRALAFALALEGNLPLARDHCDQALRASRARGRAAELEALLSRAEVEIIGGDPGLVIELASLAKNHYRDCGRRYQEARACVALAAGHCGRGDRADLVLAEEVLQRLDVLTADGTYERLVMWRDLVRAGVLVRQGEWGSAETLLFEALRRAHSRGDPWETLLLRSALRPSEGPSQLDGIEAFLRFLGLASPPRYRIVDRHGERIGRPSDIDLEYQKRELIVDLDAGALFTRDRKEAAKGRPVICGILACLIESGEGPVSPEALYRKVWNRAEYHPLRDRNALYVAVNRTRRALRQLLGPKKGIETLPQGWRAATDIDACIIQSLPQTLHSVDRPTLSQGASPKTNHVS